MVHTKIMYNTNVPDYNDSNLYIQPQSSYRIFKSEFEIISLAQFTIIFFSPIGTHFKRISTLSALEKTL